MLKYFASLDGDTQETIGSISNITISLGEASIGEFTVTNQNLSMNSSMPIRLYLNNPSISNSQFLSVAIRSTSGSLIEYMLKNIAINFEFNGQDPSLEGENQLLKVVGGDIIEIDGKTYYMPYSQVQNRNYSYWDITALDYLQENEKINISVVLLVETADEVYEIFEKSSQDVVYEVKLSIVEHIEQAVSWIDPSEIEVVLDYYDDGQIMPSNIDLSNRTESQAASIEETSASMNEITATIKDSADNSINGNKMILDAKYSIENAGNIILETTSSIEEVNEASGKIKDITKIIEDIAFQTNILALNASVEAARAGEQGKGFSVVASEVRNLAQTTQTSVKSISELIENVSDKIDKATGTARESQKIFVDVQNKINKASKIMKDISQNAVEQQNGVDQVKIAISQMDSDTQKNASLVEDAASSAKTLFNQSEKLMETVHLFKLPVK